MALNISCKEKFPAMVANVKYDIFASYPTTSTEVYEYYLGATLMFTATVTYTDATKEVFTSVEWT